MSWLSLVLTGLKVVLWLMDQAKAQQQFDAGQEAEILKQTQAIMLKTEQGKKIVEAIDAMSEDDLNKLLVDLTGLTGRSSS